MLLSANASSVELDPKFVYSREDRYTLDVEAYSYVAAIRIHISRLGNTKTVLETGGNIAPFGDNYQTGVHIYAVPVGVAGPGEEVEFYSQLNGVLELVLGVTVPSEKWILSLNSFYFHTPDILEVDMPQISGFPRTWDTLDYFYENGKLAVTTLDINLRELEVNTQNQDEYTEVGVFLLLPKSARDDLILTGARVVINDDDDTDKSVHRTMFHVKPRHRDLTPKSSFVVRENGLHPVLELGDFPPVPVDDDVLGCQLYSYFTLDKSVFVDPYQVPEQLHSVAHYGARDLELPEYAVPQWGSELLMEVVSSTETPVELTLHSRYQMPNVSSTHTDVFVDSPMVFYACDAVGDSFLLKNSPFDTRKAIGGSFEKFFTDDTVFYHVLPRETARLSIPTASGDPAIVSLATIVALMIGTLMILLAAFRKWTGSRVAPDKKQE